jgi:carboxypeptidase family protein
MRMLRITGVVAAAIIAILPLTAVPAQAAAAPTGVIEGRITDQSGAGAEATITVRAVDDSSSAYAYTWDLGDGRYRIEGLEPGDYQVQIYDNFHGTQWAPGKETREEAGVYTVGDGETVTVDDQWLPLGTVRVRVADTDTGKPVPEPCVYVRSTPQERQACGTKGLVVLNDVPPGWWEITISGGASYFSTEGQDRHVTVKRGKTTPYTVTLEPGAAIKTAVVDAATGAPLSDTCVRLIDAVWSAMSAHMGSTCTDTDGSLEIGPFRDAWTVNLYAYQSPNPWEPPATRYGDQWVGANGGTGDQRKALKVKLVPKRTRTIPAIRMDPPGTVTGILRNAGTGAPVSGVCAYPYAWHPGQGGLFGQHCSNAEGRYTIDDVGPYRWPVEFTPLTNSGYAYQWSGDVADRFSATYTQVTAGGVATVDAGLVQGGAIAGQTTNGTETVDGVLVRGYNSKTRDYAGPSWAYSDRNGAYSLPGFRTQELWVEFWSGETGCWYGTSPAQATPVHVTAGTSTPLALDLAGNCAGSPAPTTATAKRLPSTLLTSGS